MFPILFSIGPFTLHTYGLFVALGFVVGLMVTLRVGKSEGITAQQVMDMAFILILSAIIGSRLMYVLMNISYYRNNPLDTIKIWQGTDTEAGPLYQAINVPLGAGNIIIHKN